MVCAYCGKNYLTSNMTKEHVIPKAIGGAIAPVNPFILNNVCERCNTVSGLFVDGPFIRNWFITNENASNFHDFAIIEENPTLPLIFLGTLEKEIIKGKTAEVWIAPAGNTVFHFHEPYPVEEHLWSVGKPPILSQNDIDPGFVFIMISSTNPIWHPTVLNSVYNKFPDATFYIGNKKAVFPDNIGISEIPCKLEPIKKTLLELSKKHLKIRMHKYLGDDQRFLGKLAVGFGSLLFEDEYIESKDADMMRKLLWERDGEKRSRMKIRGMTMLNDFNAKVVEMLSWGAGHTIYVLPLAKENILILTVVFFGNHIMSIEISRTPELWNGTIDIDGIVYLIAPAGQRSIGPFSMGEYLNTKFCDKEDSDVARFIMEFSKKPNQPPFNIKSAEYPHS